MLDKFDQRTGRALRTLQVKNPWHTERKLSKKTKGAMDSLEDAKGIADLADYEVRSWRGLHHHVAMSLLAMMVLLTMNIELGRKLIS